MCCLPSRTSRWSKLAPLAYLFVAWHVDALAETNIANAPNAELVAYLKVKGTNIGRNELERIRSQGIAASPANVKLLRQALASPASDEERAIQIDTLGAMYDRKNTSGNNAAIKNDMKNMARSGQRNTARAAVFAVARMGGDEDLRELLQKAKDNGHIDNDEYSGELARNVRFMPKERQLEFVSLMSKSNSKYGIDVLTSEIGAPGFLAQYSTDALAGIDSLLAKSEPVFPFAIGEFSHTDAMRFTAWLQARALIHDRLGQGSTSVYILNKLSDPKLDPRKALGYLSSPEAALFLSKMPLGKLEPVVARIRTYADSLPQNQVIQEFTEFTLMRMNSLPR